MCSRQNLLASPNKKLAATVENDNFNYSKVGKLNSTDLDAFKKILDDAYQDKKGAGIKPQKGKKGNIVFGKGSDEEAVTKSKLFVDPVLLAKNKLAIKYKSNKNMKLKSINISDSTKEVVKDIMLGRFNIKLYNLLTPDEKKHVILFSQEMGIQKDLGIKDTELESLYDEFQVQLGEINAGNDNKSLIKLARANCIKLMNLHRISKAEAYNLLYQLSLM